MGLNYERDLATLNRSRTKSEAEKFMQFSKEFPNCKGLYPDCPETADLMCSMCRTCPKTDGMKKPKLED